MGKQQTTVFLTGGLGNQLFQYAAALSRDPEVLQLDCSLGNPRTNRDGEPDVFDFVLPRTPKKYRGKLPRYFFSKTAGFLLRQGMQPTKLEKNLLFRVLALASGTLSLSFWLSRPCRVVQATDNGYWTMPKKFLNEYMIGYFQSCVWAEEPRVKDLLLKMRLVRPSEELTAFLRSESNFSAIAVHVRLGDYKQEIGLGIPSQNYYAEALSKLEDNETIERIWLFSNEPEDAITFIPEKYKDYLVVVPSFRGDAAQTLEAMRHADRYIIANSSMSWWGAFLSYSDTTKVIAPQPWFKSNKEPTKLVPSNWDRLPAWPNQF